MSNVRISEPSPLTVADLLWESMRSGQTPFLTITSNSMAPLLKTGDQVGLSEVRPASLQPGDVVVMMARTTFVTHRYWAQSEPLSLTKGDRSLSFDPPWPAHALVGLVTIRRRADNEVKLNKGRGAWLNRRLWNLTRFEWRLFAGSQAPETELVSHATLTALKLRWDHRLLPAKLTRRTIYAWASLLTALVAWSERPKGVATDFHRVQPGPGR